jgi:hypothetical protein
MIRGSFGAGILRRWTRGNRRRHEGWTICWGSRMNVVDLRALRTHSCIDFADGRVHDRCQQGRDVRVLRDWALISTASQRAKSLCSPGFLPVFVCTPVQTT